MVKQHISEKSKGNAYEFIENSNSSSWKSYKIGDIGIFYSGLTGKSKNDFGTGSAKYITFLNVLCNPVIDIKILESVRVLENETQNLVAKGDLFFNTSSETPEEVGMCSTLTEDLENTYLNSFCFGFRITDPEIYPLYLSYYFNSQEGRKIMRVLAQGATRYNLSKSYFSNTEIVIPQKSEQIAIATALSDIDNLIANLEKLIAKKKAIKQGAMQELLTGKRRLNGFNSKWGTVSIGSMTDVYTGGTPSTVNEAYWGGNIPWMNSGELNKKIVRDVQGRITPDGLEGSSTRLIPANCVLIGLAGQGKTRGTAAYNTISLCTNQSIAAILPNLEKFDSKFLYYCMDMQYKELRELSAGGGGRGGLTKKLIEDFLVMIPLDITEQAVIGNILSDMDSEIEELENKLEKYKALKAGMMSELLTGRIRLVDKEEA